MAERYKTNPNSPPATPSPRTFHNATDMEHFEPYPQDDIFELSPSSGSMVMNEWDRMYCTPPDEIVPGFMWLAQERGAIMMHECSTDHFTHVLFATNKQKSPYPARNYHVIALPDDPDTDLRARYAAQPFVMWLTCCLTPLWPIDYSAVAPSLQRLLFGP